MLIDFNNNHQHPTSDDINHVLAGQGKAYVFYHLQPDIAQVLHHSQALMITDDGHIV